ncbi:hypothetical protein CPC08DRAFT_760601 [Agrocybe pediades]|nr:hypothetical protein CPC08DRAFT_760601 [Agrocybe pediades]
MMLRIYVLFDRSKRVLIFNALLFAVSIAGFLGIMIVNALRRKAIVYGLATLPKLGCPAINGGSQWAQWIPAMLFEFVLFGFAIYKTIVSKSANTRINQRQSLTRVLLNENIVYFGIVASLLIFNNLMVVGATRIPWFGFGPFHAALGITTSRMIIHLRKFAVQNLEGGGPNDLPKLATIHFVTQNDVESTGSSSEEDDESSLAGPDIPLAKSADGDMSFVNLSNRRPVSFVDLENQAGPSRPKQ